MVKITYLNGYTPSHRAAGVGGDTNRRTQDAFANVNVFSQEDNNLADFAPPHLRRVVSIDTETMAGLAWPTRSKPAAPRAAKPRAKPRAAKPRTAKPRRSGTAVRGAGTIDKRGKRGVVRRAKNPRAAVLPKGMKVLVNYKRKGKYYAATIVKVTFPARKGRSSSPVYTVAYDRGGKKESRVARCNMKLRVSDSERTARDSDDFCDDGDDDSSFRDDCADDSSDESEYWDYDAQNTPRGEHAVVADGIGTRTRGARKRDNMARERDNMNVDKRMDASNGVRYTREEFVEHYGGTDEWDAAVDKRVDSDGMLYTREEFVEHYGGSDEWDAFNAVEAPRLSAHGDAALLADVDAADGSDIDAAIDAADAKGGAAYENDTTWQYIRDLQGSVTKYSGGAVDIGLPTGENILCAALQVFRDNSLKAVSVKVLSVAVVAIDTDANPYGHPHALQHVAGVDTLTAEERADALEIVTCWRRHPLPLPLRQWDRPCTWQAMLVVNRNYGSLEYGAPSVEVWCDVVMGAWVLIRGNSRIEKQNMTEWARLVTAEELRLIDTGKEVVDICKAQKKKGPGDKYREQNMMKQFNEFAADAVDQWLNHGRMDADASYGTLRERIRRVVSSWPLVGACNTAVKPMTEWVPMLKQLPWVGGIFALVFAGLWRGLGLVTAKSYDGYDGFKLAAKGGAVKFRQRFLL